jgi:hypothetical protein
MASGPVIELETLPVRHPNTGSSLLKQCGAALVLRLSIDPTHVPKETTRREVSLDRISPSADLARFEEVRTIGWNGETGVSDADCQRLAITFNALRITEDAALAVMALLIHELEGLTVNVVLPIGSGADYILSVRKGEQNAHVEVSGLRDDESGRRSSRRLAEKCEQLLAKCPAGFASVTTFRHRKDGWSTAICIILKHRRRIANQAREEAEGQHDLHSRETR